MKNQRISFIVLFFGFLGLILLLPFMTVAQKLTATANTTNIGLNGSVQITYSLSGGKSESFKQPSFSGFNVVGTSRTMGGGMTMIVNGKVVQDGNSGSESWVYTLVPEEAGKFTIEAAKVKVNGQWINSNTLTVEVSKSNTTSSNQAQNNQGQNKQQDQSAGLSATDVFVKAVADKTSVMQGEQVTVVYKIYTRVPLGQIVVNKIPSFAGFWSTEITKLDNNTKQYNETVNGQKYVVADLRKVALFPQKSGILNIDPIDVECVAQVQVKTKANNPFAGFFNDPFFNDPFFNNQFSIGYQNVQKKLKSNTLSIKVSELPLKNKPADFIGFVGSLSMLCETDKTEVKANEPINLKITLTGKGNLNLIDKLNIEFPPDFEVYDPQITEDISASGNEVSGSKTFNYLIIPRNAGKFTIKPVSLSYFDKNKKAYQTLTSDEMAFKIGKGDGSGANVTWNAEKEDIKYVGNDIKFIEIKPFKLTSNGKFFFLSPWFFILIMLPFVFFMLFVIIMRRRIRLHSNKALLRHKKATKLALKRLKLAETFLKQGERDKFYIELSKALWGYISDKFSVEQAGLSLDTVHQTFAEKQIDESIRIQFVEILNECEFARFAPVQHNNDLENLFKKSFDIIIKTEKELK